MRNTYTRVKVEIYSSQSQRRRNFGKIMRWPTTFVIHERTTNFHGMNCFLTITFMHTKTISLHYIITYYAHGLFISSDLYRDIYIYS